MITKQDLKAIADQPPPDLLFSRAAGRAFLLARDVRNTDAALDYVIAQGWWCYRDQFGVQEVWKDGRPNWQATIQSAPRVAVAVEVPKPSPAPAAPKPAAKPKHTPAPAPGGLFS